MREAHGPNEHAASGLTYRVKRAVKAAVCTSRAAGGGWIEYTAIVQAEVSAAAWCWRTAFSASVGLSLSTVATALRTARGMRGTHSRQPQPHSHLSFILHAAACTQRFTSPSHSRSASSRVQQCASSGLRAARPPAASPEPSSRTSRPACASRVVIAPTLSAAHPSSPR